MLRETASIILMLTASYMLIRFGAFILANIEESFGRSPSGRAGRPADQARSGLGDSATIPNANEAKAADALAGDDQATRQPSITDASHFTRSVRTSERGAK